MQISPEMQSAWTELWSTGHLDSLPQDRAAGLLGALDNAWRVFFLILPNEARVLDLATGGGEVLRAALAAARNFHVTGVDITDLSAVRNAFTDADVTLVGNADLSTLPFADASFDGITSQFGLEYADIPAATREAVCVLVPGGRGQLVLHHAQSAITQGVVNNMAAERIVLGESNAFALGRKLFESLLNSAPQSEITQAETAFKNAVQIMQLKLKDERSFATSRNIVTFLSRAAAAPNALPSNEALHRLNTVEKDIQARSLRKQAQLDAALDRSGVDRVAVCLEAAGATVDPPRELHFSGGKLMAWVMPFANEIDEPAHVMTLCAFDRRHFQTD